LLVALNREFAMKKKLASIIAMCLALTSATAFAMEPSKHQKKVKHQHHMVTHHHHVKHHHHHHTKPMTPKPAAEQKQM
jgi:hypothetical protein